MLGKVPSAAAVEHGKPSLLRVLPEKLQRAPTLHEFRTSVQYNFLVQTSASNVWKGAGL